MSNKCFPPSFAGTPASTSAQTTKTTVRRTESPTAILTSTPSRSVLCPVVLQSCTSAVSSFATLYTLSPFFSVCVLAPVWSVKFGA